jgi:hypothetical protein
VAAPTTVTFKWLGRGAVSRMRRDMSRDALSFLRGFHDARPPSELLRQEEAYTTCC